MKYYLGVDPGKTAGAYTILDENRKVIEKGGLPMVGKKEYDRVGLKAIFTKFPYDHVGLEDPGTILGSSKNAVASLHKGVGLMEGMLIGLGIPHTMCKPKEWQKQMWKDTTKQMKNSTSGKTQVVDTKATTTIATLRLFPNDNWKLTNAGNASINYHDGMMDAALIAEYVRQMYK